MNFIASAFCVTLVVTVVTKQIVLLRLIVGGRLRIPFPLNIVTPHLL